MLERLSQSNDLIEWPECDELLKTRISTYIRRSGKVGLALEILSS